MDDYENRIVDDKRVTSVKSLVDALELIAHKVIIGIVDRDDLEFAYEVMAKNTSPSDGLFLLEFGNEPVRDIFEMAAMLSDTIEDAYLCGRAGVDPSTLFDKDGKYLGKRTAMWAM